MGSEKTKHTSETTIKILWVSSLPCRVFQNRINTAVNINLDSIWWTVRYCILVSQSNIYVKYKPFPLFKLGTQLLDDFHVLVMS